MSPRAACRSWRRSACRRTIRCWRGRSAYLRREQEAEGSWFGRWGTNYIYGTWSVLCAFNAAGMPPDDPAVRRAVAWLLSVQREDGGWGEDEETYRDAPHGRYKESTPSQTAWALLGLMAAGEADHPAVARGIDYLTRDAVRRMAGGASCRTTPLVSRASSICAITATAGISRCWRWRATATCAAATRAGWRLASDRCSGRRGRRPGGRGTDRAAPGLARGDRRRNRGGREDRSAAPDRCRRRSAGQLRSGGRARPGAAAGRLIVPSAVIAGEARIIRPIPELSRVLGGATRACRAGCRGDRGERRGKAPPSRPDICRGDRSGKRRGGVHRQCARRAVRRAARDLRSGGTCPCRRRHWPRSTRMARSASGACSPRSPRDPDNCPRCSRSRPTPRRHGARSSRASGR